MANELIPIDITTDLDLVRLAEEVRRTGKARLLRRGDEDLAVLSPAPPSDQHVTDDSAPFHTGADSFLAAAGGWKDLVDPEELNRRIRDERSDHRPPVEL